MAWQDRLKNLLYDTSGTPLSPNQPQSANVVTSPSSVGARVLASPADNDIYRSLLGEIESRANPDGYALFLQSVEALVDVIPDELTRYKAAFTPLAKTQQLTVTTLLQGIDARVGFLQEEMREFEVSEKEQLNLAVKGKETELSQKQVRIRELEEEIGKLRGEESALNSEITTNKQKIEEGGRKFRIAFEATKNHFEDERRKLQNLK